MKKFLIKTCLFIVVCLSIFAVVLLRVNGYSDPFYFKFTTPKKDNLILGTSRSAQGLQPDIFKKILNKEFFNYSFTISHSPYGSVYFNSIKKKHNASVRDGIYIVTIDPWSISTSGDNPNDTTLFKENNLTLSNIHFVNVNPNFEYLVREFKGKYFTFLIKGKSSEFLHKNGWLEISVPMDKANVMSRSKSKLEDYRRKNFPNRKLSTVRLNYLKQTVEYLKSHGKVYMVRLPTSSNMFNMEQEIMPNFNEIVYPVTQLSDGYLDMSVENDLYEYTDGNHLWKESGKVVSEKIARWIKSKSK